MQIIITILFITLVFVNEFFYRKRIGVVKKESDLLLKENANLKGIKKSLEIGKSIIEEVLGVMLSTATESNLAKVNKLLNTSVIELSNGKNKMKLTTRIYKKKDGKFTIDVSETKEPVEQVNKAKATKKTK